VQFVSDSYLRRIDDLVCETMTPCRRGRARFAQLTQAYGASLPCARSMVSSPSAAPFALIYFKAAVVVLFLPISFLFSNPGA
jgi:hypothetical protein